MKALNRYSLPVFIWAGLQILSACKVSKDVTTPNMDLPATYRYEQADTAKIANLGWQTFFTDNELKGLIAEALAHNNDLQVAMKNIESASLSLKQAKLGNIPVVGLQVTASSTRPSDNSLNGLNLNETLQTNHIEDYTVAASLSWEADIWGKIKSRKAATLAIYLQTEEAKKVVQTQIISDVSKAYYNLLMLDAQLAIAKKKCFIR